MSAFFFHRFTTLRDLRADAGRGRRFLALKPPGFLARRNFIISCAARMNPSVIGSPDSGSSNSSPSRTFSSTLLSSTFLSFNFSSLTQNFPALSSPESIASSLRVGACSGFGLAEDSLPVLSFDMRRAREFSLPTFSLPFGEDFRTLSEVRRREKLFFFFFMIIFLLFFPS